MRIWKDLRHDMISEITVDFVAVKVYAIYTPPGGGGGNL
jgi:hypothetical protein